MGNQSAIEKAVVDPSNEANVEAVFKELDKDGSGALNRDEFKHLVDKLVSLYGREEEEEKKEKTATDKLADKVQDQVKDKKLDKDNTVDAHVNEAKVLVNDIKGVLSKPEVTDEERFLEKLFKEADADNNGTVDFKEFVNFLHARVAARKAAGPSKMIMFGNNFVSTGKMTLYLKHNYLSATGDSGLVKTSDGDVVLKVIGKIATLHNSICIADASDNVLGGVKAKGMSIPKKEIIFDAKGNERGLVTQMKRRQGPCRIYLFAPGQSQKGYSDNKCDLKADTGYNKSKNNFKPHHKVYDREGQRIADIRRKPVGKKSIAGKNSYQIDINVAGVDYALIVLICLATDDIFNVGPFAKGALTLGLDQVLPD